MMFSFMPLRKASIRIMPMLVLRRIDVLLEPTKDKVLERKEANDAALRKAFATLGFTLETKVK